MADPTQSLALPTEAPQRGANASGGLPHARALRRSEVALIILFLALIGAVPLGQTCLELARGERVQFTDVFRLRPTAKNLREYEATLKEKSWVQQKLRPWAQRFLFASLKDTGAKGVLGLDGWLFYRPDVRYLVEPDRAEVDRTDARWVRPANGTTQRESVLQAITAYRDQLQERGIALVVMPVPGKPSVYPDHLSARAAARRQEFQSPTRELLTALQARGVATVHLFPVFGEARRETAASAPLYLAHDTHWTPAGAQLAARTVAERLRQLGVAPQPTREFTVQPRLVRRWGDVLQMMQIPGLRGTFGAEEVPCQQVVDPTLGPLAPTASERPGVYRYPGQKASVLVLGDSFSRIYQFAEPQSLGELAGAPVAPATKPEPGTKRLLPGSAGFVSHLALALQAPVDAIYSDGGASTDVRRKLSTNPEILEGKRVVVWEFVERDIALGREGWEPVPLPAKLD